MEEALRQQAISRLQRKQSQPVTADESSGDAEQAGTSSTTVPDNIPATAAVPAPEMELVFKPHPNQLALDNAIASETRYIKTTANATGMRIDFEICRRRMFRHSSKWTCGNYILDLSMQNYQL